MTTATLAEDRAVTSVAMLRGRPATFTSTEDAPEPIGVRSSGVGLWEVIDHGGPGRAVAAAYAFAQTVAAIKDVVAVMHAIDDEVHLIWTFICRRDKEVRRRVYACELWLMEQYPGLLCDFNVIARDQVPDEPLLAVDPRGEIVFYRE